MLLFTFTKILLGVRSKVVLSLLFSFVAAFLSAFLDALTVTAVIITVAAGFFGVYHKVASGKKLDLDHDPTTDEEVVDLHRGDLEQFRAFLRSLMMHGAVGTALGGVTTLVGEPQNLLIAKVMDWGFVEFFLKMAHISMPVLVAGLMTCMILELTGTFGYGAGFRSCRAGSGWTAGHRVGDCVQRRHRRTPNGQAAFLFLLTSALAPVIRLSYGRMVIMALPYTVTMSITGLAALWYLG